MRLALLHGIFRIIFSTFSVLASTVRKKYYKQPALDAIVVEKWLKNGAVKSHNNFNVQLSRKADVIEAEKMLAGVCVFVTN